MVAKTFAFSEKFKVEFWNTQGSLQEQGEVKLELEQETLALNPSTGRSFGVDVREITDITAKEHAIILKLNDGSQFILSQLGFRFDDVLREIHRYRNEVILKDMLMGEALQTGDIHAEVVFFNTLGDENMNSVCEVRVYASALVVLPVKGEVMRKPFSLIHSVEDENYSLTISLINGEKLIFSKLGSKFDYLKASLSEAMNKIELEAQQTIRDIMPSLSSIEIRNASQLLKEGLAASKSALESVSNLVWNEIEENIGAFGMRDYYVFLISLSNHPDQVSVGLKKGLMGNLTGVYLWFFVPIIDPDSHKPGNALVMEASSDKGAGRATYFFRMFSRREYKKGLDVRLLEKNSAKFINSINQALAAINFRREPIYLSEKQLKETRFRHYWHANHRIPELRELRSRFIGRVMHHSLDQWKQDTLSLLTFNVQSLDDNEKWIKGEQDQDTVSLFHRIRRNR